MSKTRLDDSRWPLVVFTAIGEQTDADIEAFLSECDVLLRRRQPYGTIFDARRSAPIGAKTRQRMVQWLSRNEALLRAYVIGTGIVMSTPLQRGVFRAILWMQPLPFPYSVETSLEGARRYVCSRLAERGFSAPPLFSWGNVLDGTPTGKAGRDVDSR